MPHAPQSLLLVLRSTQTPLHSVCPVGQVHVPPVQVRLQHSSFAVQVAPAALQNWVELHLPVVVLHAVEQQSAFLEQLSPPS